MSRARETLAHRHGARRGGARPRAAARRRARRAIACFVTGHARRRPRSSAPRAERGRGRVRQRAGPAPARGPGARPDRWPAGRLHRRLGRARRRPRATCSQAGALRRRDRRRADSASRAASRRACRRARASTPSGSRSAAARTTSCSSPWRPAAPSAAALCAAARGAGDARSAGCVRRAGRGPRPGRAAGGTSERPSGRRSQSPRLPVSGWPAAVKRQAAFRRYPSGAGFAHAQVRRWAPWWSAAAVVVLPGLLARAAAIDVAPWVSPFVALGAGGAIGFFLSRDLARNFQSLRRPPTTSAAAISPPWSTSRRAARFPDETDDLARSIAAHGGEPARAGRARAEHRRPASRSAAHELTRSAAAR